MLPPFPRLLHARFALQSLIRTNPAVRKQSRLSLDPSLLSPSPESFLCVRVCSCKGISTIGQTEGKTNQSHDRRSADTQQQRDTRSSKDATRAPS